MSGEPYEHQEGRGTLFTNKDKEANSSAPILSGSCKINGEIKDIAIWEAVSKAGNTYFNLKISEPYDKEIHENPLGTGFAHKDQNKNKPNEGETAIDNKGDSKPVDEDDIPF
tara:strand:+ start:730 stop:1065 length:336 start_codon:yes stop_codon:yes gene_type:complete